MKKKITLVATSVLLVAAMVIGGTLAYFTDVTETKENTFTVGNVDIELTEPSWDANETHNLMPAASFAKNPTITVQQGSEDAWVFMKVEMNKFNSWLRLLAASNDSDNNNLFDYNANCTKCTGECQGHLNEVDLEAFFGTAAYQAALDKWFGGVNHDQWQIMNFDKVWASIEASWSDPNIKTIEPIFGYKQTLSEGDHVTLFTSVTMPGDITSKQLADSRFNTSEKDWTLNITGYAIQAFEIDNLKDAYAALFNS